MNYRLNSSPDSAHLTQSLVVNWPADMLVIYYGVSNVLFRFPESLSRLAFVTVDASLEMQSCVNDARLSEYFV